LFPLQMAWREFRASWKKFLFAVFSVALGVGAVTGVQGLNLALREALVRESRQLIGADLRARLNSPPRSQEREALSALRSRGAAISGSLRPCRWWASRNWSTPAHPNRTLPWRHPDRDPAPQPVLAP
jgi:predicted lysophospholipase L1 biosynthesis ABC-type transport system permease subunit